MNTIVADIPMNQNIHCAETRNPFLHAFRANAAAKYERIQAQRRRTEYEESMRCRLEESMRALARAMAPRAA